VSVELLQQADYLLSSCGRPIPPPGARWVDLPYVLTYRVQNTKTATAFEIAVPANGITFSSVARPGTTITISIVAGAGALTVAVSGQTVTITEAAGGSTIAAIVAAVVASAAASALIAAVVFGDGTQILTGTPWTLTVVQGTAQGIGAAASRIENKARVQFIVRGLSVSGQVAPYRIWWANGRNLQQIVSTGSFTGAGAGLRVIQPEVVIEPGGKLIIESATITTGGAGLFYFWGVLRFLLYARGDEPEPYLPDTSRAPRIPGTQNQNIMAPEWMLGNQCCPETPPGYWDEPFTLHSPKVANPIGTTTVGVATEVPNDCEYLIVRRVEWNSVADAGVTAGVSALQIRMPNGYSLTNGDYTPQDWTGPLFPMMMVQGGGRIIQDFGDMDTAGMGNITTVVRYDGVKRRKLR
jgi:hypothetical protein